MDDDDARLCEATMLAKIEASHDLGQWLANYTPPNGVGFMFDSHPNTQRISRMVESDGHSGASFAGCIRAVQVKLKGMNRCWRCMPCNGIMEAKPACAYWYNR